jgi:hypothetical protein
MISENSSITEVSTEELGLLFDELYRTPAPQRETEFMRKAIVAIGTAAIISAGIVALPNFFSPDEQNAKPSVSECRNDAWPYAQAPCMNGPQDAPASTRIVRIIPPGRTK